MIKERSAWPRSEGEAAKKPLVARAPGEKANVWCDGEGLLPAGPSTAFLYIEYRGRKLHLVYSMVN